MKYFKYKIPVAENQFKHASDKNRNDQSIVLEYVTNPLYVVVVSEVIIVNKKNRDGIRRVHI